MMHYGSWLHQGDLDSHHCYARYMEEVPDFRHRSEQREEESEQTVDEIQDTVTSATSGDRSSSGDLFRLEFAATQWSKLVSNAEGLFQKLMTTTILPHPEQDQIEQWLCLKQEYEECIASDDTMSLPGLPENTRRSLERIEEVTETDERTDESANRTEFQTASASCSSTESEMSEEEDEDEEQSDVSSENPDFMEKLDECMSKFKTETDKMIDTKEHLFCDTNLAIISTASIPINNNNDYVPIIKPIPIRNPNSRRNSMLPGSEMCNEVMVFNGGFRPCQNKNFEDNTTIFRNGNFAEHRESNFCNVKNDNISRLRNEHSPDLLIDALKTTEDPEPIKALKTLTMNNEAKQTQMKKIQSDLDGAHKRIDELQTTIKIKERFIADMIKNSETRTSAKQRFQRKRNKLEEEYYNTRKQLAQAENASMYKASDERSTHKKEIELYKNMAIHYEKRLMDIAKIKQIAGDSAKKVFELESSLNSSKKQMEKLNRQLRKEEERKNQLEGELASDQKKIRDLEDKYNLTASKLKEMQSESEDERNISKAKNNCSDKKKNFLEVSARLSHLEHVLNEKSMDLERTADTDEKAAQALRHEIENLRRTRDSLLQEKSDLDEKWQKERTLTSVEERKRLECGETIEAIDAMIEHKNEMICGRKDFDGNQSKREKSERMLMDRLAKLSEGEMRTLFYKYFLKVIDLKESSKCLETQNAELEEHVAMQDRRMRTMMNALKQTKLEAERRIVVMQREHEEKLNLIYRHIAEETGSSGHEELDKNSELFKYKRENKILRRRLADVDALWKKPAASTATSPPRIPAQELKQIALGAKQTTKVTRQGRKLIWTATRGKNE